MLFNINQVLERRPLIYGIEDMECDIIKGNYYEQELLKSDFGFESYYKNLEHLRIILDVNKYKDDKKQIQSS